MSIRSFPWGRIERVAGVAERSEHARRIRVDEHVVHWTRAGETSDGGGRR